MAELLVGYGGASLVLFLLAAICDAIRDKITHHYNKSIFKKFKEKWWNPKISWRNKYVDGDLKKGFRYKFPLSFLNNFTDAWHTFKVIEIMLLATAIIIQLSDFGFGWWIYLAYFAAFGLAWNIPFNLFYNKILSKKG